jgi:hypothetical protein
LPRCQSPSSSRSYDVEAEQVANCLDRFCTVAGAYQQSLMPSQVISVSRLPLGVKVFYAVIITTAHAVPLHAATSNTLEGQRAVASRSLEAASGIRAMLRG